MGIRGWLYRVRFEFSRQKRLSGVFFIGEEGNLCSDFSSACTINEMVLATINRSSL